jgi:hypothetical protein
MEEHMRLSALTLGWGLAVLVANTALANEAPDGSDVSPAFDPAGSAEGVEATGTELTAPGETLEPTTAIVLEEASEPAPRGSGIVLGPKGVDAQGRTGRLHTVARGDTLWDLAAAYLGTPWVWPSVWIDNDDIANPHRISPGDKIWITATEMRVVTDAEAESFIAPQVEETAATGDAESLVEETAPVAALETAGEDDTSGLEALPVTVPDAEPAAMMAGAQVTVATRDSYGFVSAEELEGASSIVESPSERTFLAEGDEVYLGVGEGEAEVGDQYMIFRVTDEVRDFERNRVIGHHVENLGWAEVRRLTGDTSIAEIRQSYHEIARGSRVIRRPVLSRHVTLRATPDAVEGHVVYLPDDHTVAADGGYVYLNRGEFHGIEVGSALEVYDSGAVMEEHERGVDVRTPDRVVAKLLVVTVEPDSSVAFVLTAKRELEVGDTVRPTSRRQVAQR